MSSVSSFLVRFFHAIDIQEYRSLMQTVKLKILQPLVHHELVIGHCEYYLLLGVNLAVYLNIVYLCFHGEKILYCYLRANVFL